MFQLGLHLQLFTLDDQVVLGTHLFLLRLLLRLLLLNGRFGNELLLIKFRLGLKAFLLNLRLRLELLRVGFQLHLGNCNLRVRWRLRSRLAFWISPELLGIAEPCVLRQFDKGVIDVLWSRNTQRHGLLLCAENRLDVHQLRILVASTKSDIDTHVSTVLPRTRIDFNPLAAQSEYLVLGVGRANQTMNHQEQVFDASLGKHSRNQFQPRRRQPAEQGGALILDGDHLGAHTSILTFDAA